MKHLMIALTMFLAVSAAHAKAIRVECGLGELPNPHGGNASYIALYRYSEMSEYQMLFFDFGFFHFDGPVDAQESQIDPGDSWPLLTGVLKHEYNGEMMTTKMTIEKLVESFDQEDGSVEFYANGKLMTGIFPGSEIELKCLGIYQR
jgi:hypothetical protein